jgi:hypothetical protein
VLRNSSGNLSQAVFGYKHSQASVNDVLARALAYAGLSDSELAAPDGDQTVLAGCAGGGVDVPVGPANLRAARRVSSPRAYGTGSVSSPCEWSRHSRRHRPCESPARVREIGETC